MKFWIIASFAISACSLTLTRSAMMIPLRIWIRSKNSFFGAMIICHYCTSHWLAAMVVAISTPAVGGGFLLDLVLAWLGLVGISALISGVIFFTSFSLLRNIFFGSVTISTVLFCSFFLFDRLLSRLFTCLAGGPV